MLTRPYDKQAIEYMSIDSDDCSKIGWYGGYNNDEECHYIYARKTRDNELFEIVYIRAWSFIDSGEWYNR